MNSNLLKHALRDFGFECLPQVGVANFFLDIGVRDPKTPGEFIAGVECDGAAYHSEASARDRDRLRQEILEKSWLEHPPGLVDRLVPRPKRRA